MAASLLLPSVNTYQRDATVDISLPLLPATVCKDKAPKPPRKPPTDSTHSWMSLRCCSVPDTCLQSATKVN